MINLLHPVVQGRKYRLSYDFSPPETATTINLVLAEPNGTPVTIDNIVLVEINQAEVVPERKKLPFYKFKSKKWEGGR